MTTYNFVIKSKTEGVKVVTINDLALLKISVQHLLDSKDDTNLTDNLQLLITHSHISIATTQNK
jgi:hypothetical protein